MTELRDQVPLVESSLNGQQPGAQGPAKTGQPKTSWARRPGPCVPPGGWPCARRRR